VTLSRFGYGARRCGGYVDASRHREGGGGAVGHVVVEQLRLFGVVAAAAIHRVNAQAGASRAGRRRAGPGNADASNTVFRSELRPAFLAVAGLGVGGATGLKVGEPPGVLTQVCEGVVGAAVELIAGEAGAVEEV
jgi:hypothetical protein